MLLENIPPLALEIALTGTFAALLLTVLIWLFFLLRYLKVMENSILQLSTAHTATQERITQLQAVPQEDLHQLRLTQATGATSANQQGRVGDASGTI